MISPSFFPQDVSYYFSADRHGAEALLPVEMELAKDYGRKRFTDFCTGRYCMRKSMAPLGFAGEIPIGERGMPSLPDHITASLSHSKNICGAIAAEKRKYRSLGVDIETYGRVKPDMWYLLFTDKETDLLNSHNDDHRQFLATVFFSLKEAFYKTQYPLTGVFLDFPDVEVVMEAERFYIKMLRDAADVFLTGKLFEGSVYRHGDEIITYCALPV